tara:strand:- start:15579 stop:16949 length:1371 start_codon:yes stop_codon:yes gene_type:complete
MKTIKQILIIFVFAITFGGVNAQDANNPWVVTFGINAVDAYPTNSSSELYGDQGKFFGEFFNAEDHWNVDTAFSSIGVSSYLSDNFSLGARVSATNITKVGNIVNQPFLYRSIDGSVRYSLAKDSSKWQPFTELGGGYSWFGNQESPSFNFGAGLNFWFNDNVGLTYQTAYKHTFAEDGIKHFQHIFGVSLKFGGVDTDGDGVYDQFDECPEVAGLEEFGGCPDSDADGIADKDDACPNAAGSIKMNGCPDSDGDGLSDKDDACPQLAGTTAMNGCPDSDGDSINDKDDSCPTEAGPIVNNGCPWLDADSDGIPNKDDACPQLAGTASNNGCPVIPDEIITELNNESSIIRFKAESYKIVGEESQAVISKIKLILDNYPKSQIVVEGYTSSEGSKGYNQKLSEERANSVKVALTTLGADAKRISVKGFGETMPVGDNNRATGRKINRRVQFALAKN